MVVAEAVVCQLFFKIGVLKSFTKVVVAYANAVLESFQCPSKEMFKIYQKFVSVI